MELSSEDWQAINRCLIRLYKELDEQRLPRLMLQRINELVPVDSAALSIENRATAILAAMELSEKFNAV